MDVVEPETFTPVRLSVQRHDGWTAERQRIFIAALADSGSVSDAARAAGVSARSAYRLRRRPGAEAFDRAWDQALVFASQRLTAIAFDRAINGSRREVWRDGVLVAEMRAPSDRLLMFLLTKWDDKRYGKLGDLYHIPTTDPRHSPETSCPRRSPSSATATSRWSPFVTSDSRMYARAHVGVRLLRLSKRAGGRKNPMHGVNKSRPARIIVVMNRLLSPLSTGTALLRRERFATVRVYSLTLHPRGRAPMSVADELRKHACRCRSAADQMQYRFMATSLLEEAETCERAAAAQEAGAACIRSDAIFLDFRSGGALHPEGGAG
jgi:hypothetical protein